MMDWHFVHIPKTGGTSIRVALNDPDGVHRRASETLEPRFAFVRNPFERLISTYHFLKQAIDPSMKAQADCSLVDFVWLDKPIMQTQSYWLDAEVSFLGRFENLAEDFRSISDVKLPHIGGSVHLPWREYMNPELVKAIIERYGGDFKRFGYVTKI